MTQILVYNIWKQEHRHNIETDYIEDDKFFLKHKSFFDNWENIIREKISGDVEPGYSKEEVKTFEQKIGYYLPIELKYYLLNISRCIPVRKFEERELFDITNYNKFDLSSVGENYDGWWNSIVFCNYEWYFFKD